MDVKTLTEYREAAKLTKSGAARLISPLIGKAVFSVRRSIIRLEREGTADLDMIDAMATVYNAPLISLVESNQRLRSVHKKAKNACTVCIKSDTILHQPIGG